MEILDLGFGGLKQSGETRVAHDLHIFMSQVTNEMAAEYDRIHQRAAEDPGTAGDEGEENWAALLREWLPPAYHVVTKGRLIAHDGAMSPQIDVLVLQPSYPLKLREKKIWLASGVAAAFECKTTLTAKHVSDAVDRCTRFKSLYRQQEGSPRRELRSPLIYGILAHSHSWKSRNSTPIENIDRALQSGSNTIHHPRFEIDLLCVADLANWASSYLASYDQSWSPKETHLSAAFAGARGAMTSMMCGAIEGANQKPEFRPVGALIGILWQLLGWSDPSLRGIADYFRLADLQGSSKGTMRPWPLSIYSDVVKKGVLAGHCKNGAIWDEWTLGGF